MNFMLKSTNDHILDFRGLTVRSGQNFPAPNPTKTSPADFWVTTWQELPEATPCPAFVWGQDPVCAAGDLMVTTGWLTISAPSASPCDTLLTDSGDCNLFCKLLWENYSGRNLVNKP
jgi:hypothetical protein